MFFYGNYEAFRERSDAVVNSTVLTESARRGIFTYIGNDERKHIVNVLNMQGLGIDPRIQDMLDEIPGSELINNFDVGDSDNETVRNTAGYRFPGKPRQQPRFPVGPFRFQCNRPQPGQRNLPSNARGQ